MEVAETPGGVPPSNPPQVRNPTLTYLPNAAFLERKFHAAFLESGNPGLDRRSADFSNLPYGHRLRAGGNLFPSLAMVARYGRLVEGHSDIKFSRLNRCATLASSPITDSVSQLRSSRGCGCAILKLRIRIADSPGRQGAHAIQSGCAILMLRRPRIWIPVAAGG